MAKRNTGGPAFPRPASEDTSSGTLADGNDLIASQDGMDLRDYFAAQALPAIYAGHIAAGIDMGQESVAEEAYEIADAMLTERGK
jgi:hypothetical protein